MGKGIQAKADLKQTPKKTTSHGLSKMARRRRVKREMKREKRSTL